MGSIPVRVTTRCITRTPGKACICAGFKGFLPMQKIKEQAFGLAPFFVCMQRENEAQTCAAALAPFAALCLNRDIAFHKQARKAQGENDMKNILVVVDMQKDFVDGALGSPAAQAIVPAVCAAIADVRYDGIFVTLDTHGEHYAETLEGRLLPVPHCIRGTAGWALDAAVAAELSTKKWESVEKPTFGSETLAAALAGETGGAADACVTFCGLCTDICVVSNALLLRAACPNLPLRVLADACAGTSEAAHAAALATMRSCQIEVCESNA